MARYHSNTRNAAVPAQQNLTTTPKTLISVTALTATLCRGRAVAVQVGPDGAPNSTDCQIVYSIYRQTVAGTAVASTPNPIVPADVASRSGCFINYTAEGTYGAQSYIWQRVLNQRASMQWAAQDIDAMLLWPATNVAGINVTALSPTYAAPAFAGMEWDDL